MINNPGLLAAAGLLSFATNAYSARAEIPVVGIDKDGQTVQTELSPSQFSQKFSAALASAHEQTLAALTPVDDSQPGAWALRSVSVGLGFTFDVGIGPVWSFSTSPRIRLVYSNSTDAPTP